MIGIIAFCSCLGVSTSCPASTCHAKKICTYEVEPRRCKLALTQSFHIITPVGRRYRGVIIIGSTGNEYVINISTKKIVCNCPDTHTACKHILFLFYTLGLVNSRMTHVKTFPSNLLPALWTKPQPDRVKSALLDDHVNSICFERLYHSCFFCQGNAQGGIILCAKCGFLGHDHCFVSFYQPGDDCPKCGRVFYALKSQVSNGYRNYLNVLSHFGYLTSSPLQGSYQSGSYSQRLQHRAMPALPPIHGHHPIVSSSTIIPPSPAKRKFRDV